MKSSRDYRSWISWGLGAVANAITFGFAAFVGAGAGHGSDVPAMMTLAPISLFVNPLEMAAPVVVIAFSLWGAIFRMIWSPRSRRDLAWGAGVLGVHLLAALWLLNVAPALHAKAILFALTPHLALVVGTVLALTRNLTGVNRYRANAKS